MFQFTETKLYIFWWGHETNDFDITEILFISKKLCNVRKIWMILPENQIKRFSGTSKPFDAMSYVSTNTFKEL